MNEVKKELNEQQGINMNEVKEEKIIEMPSANLCGALSKAQGMMSAAKKDKKNPFFKSSYADLASVFDAIREPFACNGLSISQMMDYRDGVTLLRTRLMHESGECIDSVMPLQMDPNPQKVGSCCTYYRRYMLMAIAGVPSEDDDGHSVSGKPALPVKYITPKQVADLEALINGHSEVREKVLKNCSNDLSSITFDRYPGAVQWIRKMVEKANG